MKKLLTDNNLTDSHDSMNDNLHSSSELNSTLKKCQSLITLQRIMIIRANPETKLTDKERMIALEKNYKLDIDITKKQNPEVINQRLKKYFNMNNYERNIKKVAWKKDLSKIYLGLNDDKDNKDNEFAEYNFEKREKKKDRLIFLKNFFGQLKSVKKGKIHKKRDKSKENLLNLNKYEKYYYHNQDKYNKKVNEEELDLIFNRLKTKYSPQKINDGNDGDNVAFKNCEINFITEVNNNTNFNFKDKLKKNNFRRQNLFNSKYHLNKFTPKFKTENNKFSFPKIKNSCETGKTKSKTITVENKMSKIPIKNIKTNISDKSIFNKNHLRLTKGINKNKTYLEQLKNIYKCDSKNKYRTITNENNNFEMPDLLIYKEKPLFKKNNQLFFSPLHYSKYEQMKEIRDKLNIVYGLTDKEVFAVYNKNI